ncbi:helix-turn-helix transcriptional regulator [Salinithrix halophila]|uniref:Helix-turn-helix transcriptional regulator n=1 Tax=Salinithrix halophila TaxID=1485204 RepID=A0ABV8JMB6_9BACL
MMDRPLRHVRKKKGYTQAEVARMLGLKSIQRISNWENSVSDPPLKLAVQLLKILGEDVHYLFFGDQPDPGLSGENRRHVRRMNHF